MKSVNEVLKQTGWRSATPAANAAPTALDADDLEPCDVCGGAGFIRRPVRLGHPDFGKAFACACTENELEEERVTRLRRYSNLGPLARLTFANLSPRGRSPDPGHQESFAQAVASARRFAEEPAGWLLFTGPSGSGKTHLAAAIASSCIDSGCGALFMVVPDLLDHLRAAYQPESEVGYDELFELLKNAPTLVLDDLGVQSATPWAQEKLFQLINHRYNGRLPTVFTTNLDAASFEPRLQSRLTDPELSHVFRFEPGAGGRSDLDSLELPLLARMTFKTFEPRVLAHHNQELRDIQNVYRQAMHFGQEPADWLVIAGHSGRGKTRLAAAIANYCREAGKQVMFVVVPDLLDRLRSGYNPQNPALFDEMFEQVRNVPLLVLDDLGAHSGTAWAEEKLFQLINHRYNACLPTVITTNLAANNIEPRLASRLTDPQVSTILLMGDFDFWGKQQSIGTAGYKTATRGRPRRAD